MPIILYIGVVFSFMRSLSLDRYHFLFLDDFEGNANISVAIKSGSTVGPTSAFFTQITSCKTRNTENSVFMNFENAEP